MSSERLVVHRRVIDKVFQRGILRLDKENGGETMSYGSYNRGPREMHKITCDDCGSEAEVPFKPTEGRQVYCKECFQKHRPPKRY